MATKALFRAEDLEGIQRLTGRRYELVRGELFEVVTSGRHGEIQGKGYSLLQAWNESVEAGVVSTDWGFMLERGPDTVRGPDVAFVARGRITQAQRDRGFPPIAPDLAIEVRSPNDTWPELLSKVQEYFDAGTRMAVLIEPDRFLEVHRPGQEPRRLNPEDRFSGEDVLPGFSCRVADFFPKSFV